MVWLALQRKVSLLCDVKSRTRTRTMVVLYYAKYILQQVLWALHTAYINNVLAATLILLL